MMYLGTEVVNFCSVAAMGAALFESPKVASKIPKKILTKKLYQVVGIFKKPRDILWRLEKLDCPRKSSAVRSWRKSNLVHFRLTWKDPHSAQTVGQAGDQLKGTNYCCWKPSQNTPNRHTCHVLDWATKWSTVYSSCLKTIYRWFSGIWTKFEFTRSACQTTTKPFPSSLP